jgi:diadenosine tetraphosphatase ApaH/serine/threonine PP2A family protein phosphatase
VVALVFIGGNDLRAAEIRRIAPDLELTVVALQTGFSTSAPEPGQRARDQLLAHPLVHAPGHAAGHPPGHAASGAIAEAVDLTTMAGKSLRLELESENENRFCKWWRETPVQMHVAIALRRASAPSDDIALFTATCDGQIADQPAGSRPLGWDRLFVPAGEDATLAQLIDAGEVIGFRREVYAAVVRALGSPG